METVISPILLYAMIALGGLGVLMAMPRDRVNLALPGFALGAIAGGVVLAALGVRLAQTGLSVNLYFYIFSFIALAAALRVITHPKPVYSALYFILTILATSGLFLILSAEFMAFALIIIYAGAILITYLFVIMLATQAPVQQLSEAEPVYERVAREPVVATLTGFILLAVLTTEFGQGVGTLSSGGTPDSDRILAQLPLRIERALHEEHLLGSGEGILPNEALARSVNGDGSPGPYLIDPDARTAVVQVQTEGGARRTVAWPADLELTNTESVGWELIKEHPGAIEMAGVILLMAMLGAVVLARKQMQIDEDAKRDQALGMNPPAANGEGA